MLKSSDCEIKDIKRCVMLMMNNHALEPQERHSK